MEKTSLCFIGAGFQASTNIYPSACQAGAEIKAAATRSLQHSREALLRFGSSGTPYEDYKRMLKDEDCQGVVVVAQPHDQPSMVMNCIRAGKNVFVEKPLGWTSREAYELAEAAEKAGTILMVGFMKRYAPCYTKLKEIMAAGSLGAPRSFNAEFSVNSTAFCRNEEDYLKLAAIHYVDLLRFLFGECVGLSGFKKVSGSDVSQCIALKFDSGVVGNAYFTGMTAWSRESEKIMITFDDGFASAEEINKVVIHKSSTSKEVSWQSHTEEDIVLTPSCTPMSGAYRDLYLRGFVGEMSHFMDCIKNGIKPLSSGEDNVKTMKLCEDILCSLI